MKRLAVLLGVAGVSLSAVFVRWSTAPSLILVLYRVGMAAALLAPYTLLRHREELRTLAQREVLLCLASGAFLGLHFAAYFESLRYTSIASSVVLVDTEVLFVALGTVLVLRQRLSGRAWLAVTLAFGGSVVIAMADTAVGPDAVRGDIIALSGALCMAVFCTLLGHSVFSWGLKYLSPAFISTAKLLEPVFASVWGLALFGERPGLLTLLGGAVIIAGVALYGRAAGRETERKVG